MKRRFSRVRAVVLAALTAMLVVPAGQAAAATEGWDQNIPLFLLADDSLGVTIDNGQVVLAAIGSNPAGRWNVTEIDPDDYYTNHTYTNVDTGECLAAPSVIDGLQLKLVPCAPADLKQQWHWSANRLYNEYTGKCVHTEARTAGARLYQDTCASPNWRTSFSDLLRVRLDAVCGDDQMLTEGQRGDAMTVRLTDEQGTPLEGFRVNIELRGVEWGEPGSYLPSPVEFVDGRSKLELISDAQGLVTTPAIAATTGHTGRFIVDVEPRFKLYTDVHVLQAAGLDGVVE